MAINARTDPYVLLGRVVTMDAERHVIDDGALYIQGGIVRAVAEAADGPPAGFENAPRIATGDTLYPGLIELHNHLAYNAVPLWRVPKKYEHNMSWRGTDEAKRAVSKPAEVLARTPGVVESMVRYAECRCLFGGVTTSQGITLATRPGIRAFFKGFIRNVEQSLVPALPNAGTRIANPDSGGAQEYLKDLRGVSCRLQHLSEGLGETPREWFLRLRLPDVNGAAEWAITAAFCGIHATALQRADLDVIHRCGGSVVWSPLSNYLLYGDTADIAALRDSKVLMGLGSDWSPSGSKNLLGELKVAWLASEQAGNGVPVFSPSELVAMATINPARICKWDHLLGSMEPGKLADIIAVTGTTGDPYEHLLGARETAITLVVIDGVPRLGQITLMEHFAPIGAAVEQVTVGGSQRLLDLAPVGGPDPLGGLTLADARTRLRDALAVLPTLAADIDNGLVAEGFTVDAGVLLDEVPNGVADDSDQPPRWVVQLDFAAEDDALDQGVLDNGSLVEWVEPMAFEDLTVADDPGFLPAIVHAKNVPHFVKEGLPPLYGQVIAVPPEAAGPQLDAATDAELGEVVPLAEFLRSNPGQLTPADRARIVEQAIAVLENHYVHLPLKQARYAVDPLQRLRVLRRDLDASGDRPASEMDFHAEVLDIFGSLRDLHTTYRLPFPYRSRVAWLPFLVEECEDAGVTRYLVTRLVNGFDPGVLRVGAEVLYWNAIPVDSAIRQLERVQSGSNPAARRARALAALTIRPLGHMPPPPEEWVTVTFQSPGSDVLEEQRMPWLVSAPNRGVGRIELDELGVGATELGVDSQVDQLNDVRKIFFAEQVVHEERAARAKGRRMRTAGGTGEIATSLPTVLRARLTDGGRHGYLRIFSFNTADPDEFVDECERLLTELPADGLIIDVRGNGGGSIVAAESLLQLLSPQPIEPERAQFIATATNLRLCQQHAQSQRIPGLVLEPWLSSIDTAIETGAPYSAGFPITDPEQVRSRSQAYRGPKVLVVDPLCYSATDMFAAGFADHGIGTILGVGHTTGAGGANVWSHRILRTLFGDTDPASPPSPYAPLPLGSDLRVAIRRTLRVGENAGEIVEDLGVVPDKVVALTRADVLGQNDDLLAHAAQMLREQPHRALDAELTGAGTPAHITVTGVGIDRVDIRVNDWHLQSLPYNDEPIRVDLDQYQGPRGDKLDIELSGISDGTIVARRRLSIPAPPQ